MALNVKPLFPLDHPSLRIETRYFEENNTEKSDPSFSQTPSYLFNQSQTYDYEEKLRKSLSKVLSQTYKKLNII